MGRRLPGHDYRAKCKYHITMTKAPGCPDFGHLTGGTIAPKVAYSPIGLHICRHLRLLPALHPRIELKQYIIMPDHIHLLLFVTDTLDLPLGNYLGKWKNRLHKTTPAILSSAAPTEGAYAAETAFTAFTSAESAGGSFPIFTENFHDRIIFPGQDLNAVYEYIRANPYRLAVRRECPGFFRRIHNFRIDGNCYQLYGNPFLIRNPFKGAVIVHRRYSPSELASLTDRWMHIAANGGVLVSPFISEAEKSIMYEAASLGGRIIKIQNRAFPDKRFKPAKAEFELCAEGHLLLVAPMPESATYHTPFLPEGKLPGDTVSRSECLLMNALAEAIVDGRFG